MAGGLVWNRGDGLADDVSWGRDGGPRTAAASGTATMAKHGSYWAGTGTHQAEFKRLRSALVPVDGAADTPDGELLRAMADLYAEAKRHGMRDVAGRWGDWHAVYARRAELVAAIGAEGSWVFAVVDRAMTERYLAATYGDGGDPRAFPHDAFERLMDACIVVVRGTETAAAA